MKTKKPNNFTIYALVTLLIVHLIVHTTILIEEIVELFKWQYRKVTTSHHTSVYKLGGSVRE